MKAYLSCCATVARPWVRSYVRLLPVNLGLAVFTLLYHYSPVKELAFR